MSTARQWAAYCSDLSFEDVPSGIRSYACDLVADTVGVAIGAARVESTDAVLAAARQLSTGDGATELPTGATEPPTGATVWATGERFDPPAAAFSNGAMAHSLDYDDSHRGAALHPGAPVVAAALAAAEAADATGRELLRGVVAGYEVACRLGVAVEPSAHYDRGFHVTGTCGVFGATAAIGSVRGLDAGTLAAAFGVNGSQAAGSVQFVENGGWNKRVHPGLAARSAFTAVALAEQGFVAADEPVDGDHGFLQGYSDRPNPDRTTAELGETFELGHTAIKPYPCCRFMHMPIELLSDLRDEHELAAETVEGGEGLERIERVEIAMPEPGVKMLGDPASRYPESFVDAQFHMPFVAALVLVHDDASLDTFLGVLDDGPDPAMERLIDRTRVREADWIEDAYPDALPGEVVVETAERTVSARGTHPRGEPENPLSRAALREKFDALTGPVVGDDAATAVRRRIEQLDDATPVSALTAPLRDAGSDAGAST